MQSRTSTRKDQTATGIPRDGKRSDRARKRDADRRANRRAKYTVQGRTR